MIRTEAPAIRPSCTAVQTARKPTRAIARTSGGRTSLIGAPSKTRPIATASEIPVAMRAAATPSPSATDPVRVRRSVAASRISRRSKARADR